MPGILIINNRRKDTCAETLNLNRDRIKDYVNRVVLYPRRGKYAKKAEVKEAVKEKLSAAEASFQNTTREVIRKFIIFI